MCNIISLEDLEEDEDYAALLDDLTQGCAQFGTVVKLHVPRIRVRVECVHNCVAWREGGAGSGLRVRPVRVGVGGGGCGEGAATEDVQWEAGPGGLLPAVAVYEGSGCGEVQ